MSLFVRYGLPAIVVLAAVAAPAIAGLVVIRAGDENLYENQIAACERGNPTRATVYTNTVTAVRQSIRNNDPPRIIDNFRGNVKRMLAVEGVDPKTGEVDCEAVIEKP